MLNYLFLYWCDIHPGIVDGNPNSFHKLRRTDMRKCIIPLKKKFLF